MARLRLQHDSEKNALRLTLDHGADDAVTIRSLTGVVDVAANGRLVGIELATGGPSAAAHRLLRRWLDDSVAGEFISIDPDGVVYIELTAGESDESALSSEVDLSIETSTGGEMLAVSIPRRGNGYEISYPSGNR